jgi:hypothetical protein
MQSGQSGQSLRMWPLRAGLGSLAWLMRMAQPFTGFPQVLAGLLPTF